MLGDNAAAIRNFANNHCQLHADCDVVQVAGLVDCWEACRTHAGAAQVGGRGNSLIAATSREQDGGTGAESQILNRPAIAWKTSGSLDGNLGSDVRAGGVG